MSDDFLGSSVADYSKPVQDAREYYNSSSADRFYASIWGGKDIHIGIYESEADEVAAASERTVERMAHPLVFDDAVHILDIGSGYGGSARYLARKYGCRVTCLNLSEVQNERNRALNAFERLDSLIGVVDGSFEAIPSDNKQYEIVWSQDAVLHSGNRGKVLEEVSRVIKSNGNFVFTDPMQSDHCPEGVLTPVLERIHLESLGSPSFYRQELSKLGFDLISFEDLSDHLVLHYKAIRRELMSRWDELAPDCGVEYLSRMKEGLQHWVDAGEQGYLCWGIFNFRKN